MASAEKDFSGLQDFLPPHCLEGVLPYFRKYPIHLTLTRERKTLLGNYRAPHGNHKAHRITVNGNLNPYSFLITLLHELAHLLTYEQYQRRARPHGPEWKQAFRETLVPFLQAGVFPEKVSLALQASIQNLSASTCTDENLFRALWQYDVRKPGAVLAGDLKIGAQFTTEDGTGYEVLERGRSRLKCRQLATRRLYLFPFIAEVVRANPEGL